MILLMLIMNLWASDVVIQGSETQDITLERHLLKHPNHKSYIQHLSGTTAKEASQLYRLLKRAQFDFLSGSLDLARKSFQKIADLKHRANWNKDQRKAIHFSLLRLAQIEKDDSQKANLINQAIAFDEYIPIDTNIFPPPFAQQYQNIFKNLSKNIWSLPKGAESFHQVLINGRKVKNRGGFLQTHAQMQRISFQSNRFQEVVLIGKPKDIMSGTLALRPLATGDCDTPEFQIPMSKEDRFVFLNDTCEKTSSHKQSIKTLPLAGPAPLPSKSTSIYKNKWLWIGLSVVATGFAYAHLNQNKRGNAPSQPTQPTVQTFTNQ